MEKAFTVNEAQAREVFRLAKEKNVFITEAIWTRYMPFVRTMKEVLASGVIGKPVCLSANLGYAIKGKERIVEPALAGGSDTDLQGRTDGCIDRNDARDDGSKGHHCRNRRLSCDR